MEICWLDGVLYVALFIKTFPNSQKYEQKQILEQFNGSSKEKYIYIFCFHYGYGHQGEKLIFPDTDRHLGNDQTHGRIDKSIYKEEPQPFLKDQLKASDLQKHMDTFCFHL